MLTPSNPLRLAAVPLIVAALISAPSFALGQETSAPSAPSAPVASDQTPSSPILPSAPGSPSAPANSVASPSSPGALPADSGSATDDTVNLGNDTQDTASVDAQIETGEPGLNTETLVGDAPVLATEDASVAQSTQDAAADTQDDVSVTAPYFDAMRTLLPESLHDESDRVQSAADTSARFLRDGGPSIWAIAALSVITVAVILWKIWRLALAGAWSKGRARKAVSAYEAGDVDGAFNIVKGRRGVRSKVVSAALKARRSRPDDLAREDTARVAKNELANASTGLRALELIATIAPLLGLLGTVLGMIAAFQALQESGSRADPALLAGGIWEALLTTAAGMAVAIPASAALAWFEAVIDRMRRDIEDAVTRIFVADAPVTLSPAPDIAVLQIDTAAQNMQPTPAE